MNDYQFGVHLIDWLLLIAVVGVTVLMWIDTRREKRRQRIVDRLNGR